MRPSSLLSTDPSLDSRRHLGLAVLGVLVLIVSSLRDRPETVRVASKSSDPLWIEVNVDPPALLCSAPTIGPALARRISEQRELAPFESESDLDLLPGIGPATLDRIRPHFSYKGRPVSAKADGAVERRPLLVSDP